MQLKLDDRFKKTAKGMFEKYNFVVGILEDKAHKNPKRGVHGLKGQEIINIYAGGPVRQMSTTPGPLSVSEVSESFRKNTGINYLTEPFKKRDDKIIKFANEFLKLCFGKSTRKRVENLLQAIVRNPILRGDYGHNSRLTRKIKGFDRLGIDTGQLFKNIKASVRTKRV